MSEVKKSDARIGSNEWKLFKYFQTHSFTTSRDSKYPPLEIMDLPKLVSVLIDEGYRFMKIPKTKKDKYGNTKRYVEYRLLENVEVKENG